MADPKHYIDDLFNKGIERYTEFPSDEVWENLEADLDRRDAVIYKRKYKSLRRYAVILSLLFIGLLLYEAVNNTGDDNKELITTNSNIAPGNNSVSHPDKDFNNHGTINENNSLSGLSSRKSASGEKNIKPSISDGGRSLKDNIVLNPLSFINKKLLTDEQEIESEKEIQTQDVAVEEEREEIITTSAGISRGNELTDDEQVKKVLFTLMPAGYNKKFSNDLRLPVFRMVDLPQEYKVPKKVKEPLTERFSLMARFSPALVLNTVKDDHSHDHRGRGGNGGGNNGGGNGSGSGSGNNNGGGRRDDSHNIKRYEQNELAYFGSLLLDLKLSRKISIQTGLNLQSFATSVNSKKIYAARDSNGLVGYRINYSSGYTFYSPTDTAAATTAAPVDSIILSESCNKILYLGIPLTFEYTLITGRRFSLAASLGVQANILLRSRSTSVFNKGTPDEATFVDHVDGLKPVYFSALAGITAEYAINRRLSFTLTPNGRLGLSYMNMGSTVKTRQNYLGIAGGFRFKL